MMTIPTPYHLMDMDRLNKNLEKIHFFKKRTGCRIIIALKGFSEPYALSKMASKLDGAGASGLFEARMGKEIFQKYVFTHSPAFEGSDIYDIVQLSDAISFNSMYQYQKYHTVAYSNNCSCGIRINPQHSLLPEEFKANPCKQFSRLGIIKDDMPPLSFFGEKKIEGLHIHAMCEQYSDSLRSCIELLVKEYDPYLQRIKWLNLGGGQLFGKDDYDLEEAIQLINALKSNYGFEVVMEPCTGIVVDCGMFVTSVIDIVKNEKNIAIIDASAVCHIPDVAFIGWRHDVINEVTNGPYHYIIAGNSCYASDIWGEYTFEKEIKVGDRIIFKDTAMYSMVKANFFNGLKMPRFAVQSKEKGIELITEYDYHSFFVRQF